MSRDSLDRLGQRHPVIIKGTRRRDLADDEEIGGRAENTDDTRDCQRNEERAPGGGRRDHPFMPVPAPTLWPKAGRHSPATTAPAAAADDASQYDRLAAPA